VADTTSGRSPEEREAVLAAIDKACLDLADLAEVMGTSVDAVRRRRNRGETPLPPPTSGHGITSCWDRVVIAEWLTTLRPRGWLAGVPRKPRETADK
jgi:hypothetical protein